MTKKVLVVDDDRDFLRLMAAWLKAEGMEVVVAMDCMSCISVARKQVPDLIVLDIGMPAGNGFVALQRLRSLVPLTGVPIVVASGQDEAVCRPKAEAAGADDYVEKRSGREAIMAVLRRHLGVVTQTAS